MTRYNIYIINFFGTQNKGDIAILIGMLEAFKTLTSQPCISICSHDLELTEKCTKEYDTKIIERIIKRRDGKNLILWSSNILLWIFQCNLWALLKIIGIDIKHLFSTKKRELLKAYDESDLIISSGGGYIHDNHGPIILLALQSILTGLLLKKKVVLYSQSIGPINNKLYRFFTKLILNKVTAIQVREVISKQYLGELGIKKPHIIVTADPAFIHPPIDNEKIESIMQNENIRINKSSITIGITVRYWHFPGFSDPKSKFKEYKSAIAHAADYLIDEFGAEVIFIPMIMANAAYDERIIASDIIKEVRNPGKTKIIQGEYSPTELRAMVGQMDLLIGTRFHSVIFAMTMGVPAISIMYEHKSMGIMKMMNLEHFIIDINNLEKDTVTEKINLILNDRNSVITTLTSNVKLLQKLAKSNAEYVNQLMN